MTAEQLTWIARQVPAESLAGVRAMGEALGLAVLVATEEVVVLQTERGDVVEYCGPGHQVPDYLFAVQQTVFGFQVDDLEAAAGRMAAAGCAPIAAAGSTGSVSFQHFRDPGGLVVGLIAANG